MRFPFQKRNNQIENFTINSGDKICFIHIPKTGGTSIGKILGIESPIHKKAIQYELEEGNNFFKNRFSFGVVRNPFDRFLSLYNYARLEVSCYHNNLDPSKAKFGKHLDYQLLKNASVKDCAKFLIEGKLQHDMAWNHWLPQFTWLYDRKGEKCLVDKVYKLEELEELQNDLNTLGIKFKSFPVLNTSKLMDYKDEIDPESKILLEKYYQKDLQLFSYKF